MEHTNTGETNPFIGSPFGVASQFGWALNLARLPGWSFQLAYEGGRTYGIWTDGRRVLYRVAARA